MILRTALRVCAALTMALLIALPAQAQQGAASKVINDFHDLLLGVMRQASTMDFAARYAALAPAVAKAFNLELMAKYAVTTRHWRQMDAQQQQQLARAFTQFTVTTYADRFDGYSGQRFEVLGEEAGPRSSVVVQSQIIDSDGDPIRIDYLMQQAVDGWRIVDVFLKGAISELATRRSEYVSVIERRGYDGLINAIAQQAQKISDGA